MIYTILMLKKKATLSFVKGSFNLHNNSGLAYRPKLCGWSPSPTCLAKLSDCWKHFFSSSKTISAYLQYGKVLFASWLCHTPLTGLPGPHPSPIFQPWDILGQWINDCIPSQLPHFPNSNTNWLNNDNVFQGGGVQPQASFKHAQKAHRMHA